MSSPSSTAIPTTPMTMPATRTGESRSSSPASRAVSAATNGTPATNSPVSEDDSCVSAQDSSSHGIVISSTVKTASAPPVPAQGRAQPTAGDRPGQQQGRSDDAAQEDHDDRGEVAHGHL